MRTKKRPLSSSYPECANDNNNRNNNNNNNNMDECEMKLIEYQTESINDEIIPKMVQNATIKRIYAILINFIRKRKLVCYGGSAINAILPKSAKFYDEATELPDYDVFSANAIQDAKDLVDVYTQHGFDDVEARSGMHVGTFKVFVNFVGILDLTEVPQELFHELSADAIVKNQILNAPPLYLRMALHLELSRPKGDISRWEKVASRLQLLDQHFPYDTTATATTATATATATQIPISRTASLRKFIPENTETETKEEENTETEEKEERVVQDIVYRYLVKHQSVFFGMHALAIYREKDDQKDDQKETQNQKQYSEYECDVLVKDPVKCAIELRKKLSKYNVKVTEHPEIGEIVPEHATVYVDGRIVATLYDPVACHNYNEITYRNRKVRIATTDTIQSLYLAFSYVGSMRYNKAILQNFSKEIDALAKRHRLQQSGVWRRFGLPCYGDQATLETIRSKKAAMFAKLKQKKNTPEYERWFLRYTSADTGPKQKTKKLYALVGLASAHSTSKRKRNKTQQSRSRIVRTKTVD